MSKFTGGGSIYPKDDSVFQKDYINNLIVQPDTLEGQPVETSE